MIPMHDADVELAKIDPPRLAARESIDPDKLADLADDMLANGLLQRVGLIGPDPEGRYEVNWGDRRTRAARQLGWRTIPARVAPHGTNPAAMRAAENNVREPLNPREEARQVKELLDAGVPLPNIRRTLRRSEAWIEQRLALLGWPEDIQQAVAEGRVPLAVARQLVKIDNELYRADLTREAVRTGATERTAIVWAAAYEADRARIDVNSATVQELIERRDSFQIVTECESCRDRVDIRTTRLIRICAACNAELVKAQHEQLAAEQLGHPQS
jgi:ParB/RepB/Spo0J family partition protein